MNDYRVTKYCPSFTNIISSKKALEDKIKKDHPKIKDMHSCISTNRGAYKEDFISIYNEKCAYCGVSTLLISKGNFEIDHVIYKKSFDSKASAGFIENLVLSCAFCNNNKNSFDIRKYIVQLHPDRDWIKEIFIRDKDFYIKIANKYENDSEIVSFYKQLALDHECHRLDYLIMSLDGLSKKHKNIKGLDRIVLELIKKRNKQY